MDGGFEERKGRAEDMVRIKEVKERIRMGGDSDLGGQV